jgi:hypothetical protein
VTALASTVFRVVAIGRKRYALGLHPRMDETLISIREVGRRVGYVLPVSALRIHAALAFGRAELAAKRAARKNGVPWRVARRVFMASVIPPVVKMRRKGGAS